MCVCLRWYATVCAQEEACGSSSSLLWPHSWAHTMRPPSYTVFCLQNSPEWVTNISARMLRISPTLEMPQFGSIYIVIKIKAHIFTKMSVVGSSSEHKHCTLSQSPNAATGPWSSHLKILKVSSSGQIGEKKTEFKVHHTRSESTFSPLPALKVAQHQEAGPQPPTKLREENPKCWERMEDIPFFLHVSCPSMWRLDAPRTLRVENIPLQLKEDTDLPLFHRSATRHWCRWDHWKQLSQ